MSSSDLRVHLDETGKIVSSQKLDLSKAFRRGLRIELLNDLSQSFSPGATIPFTVRVSNESKRSIRTVLLIGRSDIPGEFVADADLVVDSDKVVRSLGKIRGRSNVEVIVPFVVSLEADAGSYLIEFSAGSICSHVHTSVEREVTIAAVPAATLEVSKIPDSQILPIGGSINFSLSVKNIGVFIARNVRLTDETDFTTSIFLNLPLDAILIPTDDSRGFILNVGDLGPGESFILSPIGLEALPDSAIGIYHNILRATASNAETVETSTGFEVVIPPAASLIVDITSSSTEVNPGGEIDFLIEVTNDSDVVATNVRIAGAIGLFPTGEFVGLPPGTNIDSTDDTIEFVTNPATFLINLQPHETFVLGYGFRVGLDSRLGSFFSRGGAIANNAISVESEIIFEVVPPASANLSVSITGESTVRAGTVNEFTVSVRNVGEITAQNVVLADRTNLTAANFINLPAGAEIEADEDFLAFVLRIGDLEPNGSLQFTYGLLVHTDAEPGLYANTFEAAADNADIAPTTLLFTVEPRILTINKTVFINENDITANYRLSIRNNTDQILENVTVTDIPPQSFGEVTILPEGFTVDPCNHRIRGIITLQPNEERLLGIQQQIFGVEPGEYENILVVVLAPGGIFEQTVRFTVDELPEASLNIVKSSDKSAYASGTIIFYTIQITNTSDFAANNVIVTDHNNTPGRFISPLPSGIIGNQDLHINVGTLLPSETYTATARYEINTGAHGTFSNIASAKAINALKAETSNSIDVVRCF